MKTFLLLLALSTRAFAADFYVDSRAGSDASPGTSAATAWKTLAKAGARLYQAGDGLWLKKGCVWNEELGLKGRGTVQRPIRLGAYGSGDRPKIDGSGRTHALSNAGPLACWQISGLEISSSLRGNPQGKIADKVCGIHFKQSELSASLSIRDCQIHDCDGEGILLEAEGPSKAVFSDVVIEDCTLSNVWAGVSFEADSENRHFTAYFPRFVLRRVNVHDTGSDGLVPFFGNHGVIEHCKAWRCGLGWTKRSPVAIWFAFDDDCVIQYCEAWDNHPSGQHADGGGFDIDGGCERCEMRYNYSHDNEGAGYLLCSFDPKGYPTRHCSAHHNLSVNDGLSNGYASIVFWQPEDCEADHNTCVTNGNAPLRFMQVDTRQKVFKNIFVEQSGDGIPLIQSDLDLSALRLEDNLFWASGGAAKFELASGTVSGLQSLSGLMQAKDNALLDPGFVNAGKRDFRLKEGSKAKGWGCY
jgi:hypothetical protein